MNNTGHRTARPLAYIFGAIVVYATLKYVSFTKNLDVTFSRIRLGGSFLYPDVYVTLSIFNPTDFAVKINSISGTILYQDKIVSTVYSNTQVNVTAKKRVELELKLSTTFSDILSTIKVLIQNGVTAGFYFNGTIDVDGVNVPVNTKLAI